MATEISSLQAEDRYLKIEEISEYLQIPKATLYKYTSRNTIKPRLKGIRIGRTLRFKISDVDQWLRELEECE
jgi:excisionase family DNA binding protein